MARYIDADVAIRLIEMDALLQFGYSKRDAIDCIKATPTVDVVQKSEEGAECPTCHGTGRIGTTDWLTKNISKKQLAEEKAKAIAEHEQYIKTEYAREIFEEIEKRLVAGTTYYGHCIYTLGVGTFAELKKKYTEGVKNAEKNTAL